MKLLRHLKSYKKASNFLINLFNEVRLKYLERGKKWFCYGNKIRYNKYFFVAATKNFAAATKRFVDRTKNFVVITRYFCYAYFKKNDFVGITKSFIYCNFLR